MILYRMNAAANKKKHVRKLFHHLVEAEVQLELKSTLLADNDVVKTPEQYSLTTELQIHTLLVSY